jgi:hypothetical protein
MLLTFRIEEEKRENSNEDPFLDEMMFRHKQKYKSGKKKSELSLQKSRRKSKEKKESTNTNFTGSSSEELLAAAAATTSEIPNMLLSKLFEPEFTEFSFPVSGPGFNDVYENPFPTSRVTLKWAPVHFQSKCSDFSEMKDSPIGKSCVIPSDPSTPLSLCMVSLAFT